MTITLKDNLKIWYQEVSKLRGLSEVLMKYTKSYHSDNMNKLVKYFYMLTQFSDYVGEIPKDFLVGDNTQQELADKYNTSHGYVRVLVKRYYDKYEKDFGDIDVVDMILTGTRDEDKIKEALGIVEDLLKKYPANSYGVGDFFIVPLDMEEDFQPQSRLILEKDLVQALQVLRGDVREILERKVASVPKEVREYVLYLLTEEVVSGREKEEQQMVKEALWYDGFD